MAEKAINTHGIDGTAVVDESFKFNDLWNQVQIDSHAVRSNDRLNLESYTGVACFEGGWGCRGDGEGTGSRVSTDNAAITSLIAERLWNLRRLKLGGIAKLADDLDDRALTAFGHHPRS